MDTPVIEAVGLSRTYGGINALSAASLAALAGEVHALVGENGAGKSTLIRLLCGRAQPSAGETRMGGVAVSFNGPIEARRMGVSTVFQELTLLPTMTVAENLMLTRERRYAGLPLVDTRGTTRSAEELLATVGLGNIDPRATIAELDLATRQLIEIARGISNDPKVVLFDEPTSSLSAKEVDWLFERIISLRSRGVAMIFTSHRWSEIKSIADRITVFRNGTDVGTFTDISESDAVALMIGRRVEALYPARNALVSRENMLEVKKLDSARLKDVSFHAATGEILGIGGLSGHGHRDLFLALFGVRQVTSGEIFLRGLRALLRSPRAAMNGSTRIALIPEDRKTEGVLLKMSVRDNMTLAILRKRLSRLGFIRRKTESDLTLRFMQRLKVKVASPYSPVGSLSGGNQQKVLLAKWLLTEPEILLLYDVTRGVDVGTKAEIYLLIQELASQGRTILLYSSDAEELAHLCHRVLVMREGRIVAEIDQTELTTEAIISAAVTERSHAQGAH